MGRSQVSEYLSPEDNARYEFILKKRRNKERLTSKEVWDLECLDDLKQQLVHDSAEYKEFAAEMDANLAEIIREASK